LNLGLPVEARGNRLRPERRNHLWSYDFVEAQTHDGRKVRLMTLIDAVTRECLASRVARRINSLGGVPEHIRSDNGAEMTAKIVRSWLASVGATTLYIAPGSPGRTAVAKASMASFATNCSMARSSTASRKLKSSSASGAITTTRSGYTHRCDIGHRRRKLLRRRCPI
jgi:transposase InsO family protein